MPVDNTNNSGTSPGKFTRLLWRCAGADEEILAQCPRADHVKYQGLGGVVLATGVLAFVSGGYAFYTVFVPKTATAIDNAAAGVHWPSALAAMLAGAIWALIIFNIERFIVSSTGKGDGTDKITLSELGYATPRIIMALIFGLCLSKPLEIRILQSEINAELVKRQNEYSQTLDDAAMEVVAADLERLRTEIVESRSRVDQITVDIEARRQEISSQYAELEDEAEGLSGSGIPGRGPAWQDKMNNLRRLERDDNRDRATKENEQGELRERIESNEEEISEIEANIEEGRATHSSQGANLDGLLQRIQIAHDLSPMMSWMMTLLLLMIETGPIFFKMMVSRSTYDYLSANKQQLMCAAAGVETQWITVSDDGTEEGNVNGSPGFFGHIWRAMFGGTITDPKQRKEEKIVYHEAQKRTDEARRQLETERKLAEAIHAEFRRRVIERIGVDVSQYLVGDMAAVLGSAPAAPPPAEELVSDVDVGAPAAPEAEISDVPIQESSSEDTTS